MMRLWKLWPAMALLCVLVQTPGPAATLWSDLSPEARALLPEGRSVVLELKDGRRVEGLATRETPEQVVLQIPQRGGLWMTRPFARADIANLREADISPFLGERLLQKELDPERSLPEARYREDIALFREFLERSADSEAAPRIADRLGRWQAELDAVLAGQEKVEGEWFTPVRASVRRFALYTGAIENLQARRDARTDPDVRQRIEELTVERRDVARRLPRLLQDRIDLLLSQARFEEPVEELNAFIDFWMEQVLRSEGPARRMFERMDFDYIRGLQRQIMNAYRASGQGNALPAAPPPPDMTAVPGGLFWMGNPEGRPGDNDFPPRLVFLSPYWIDRHEVTNAEYRRFLEHMQRTRDESLEHPDAPPLKQYRPRGWDFPDLSGDDQPVVGVDWFDAYTYARWADKRLPTEAEWEKAARGRDGRIHPWGDAAPARTPVNTRFGRRVLAAEMDRQNPPRHPDPPPRSGFGCVRRREEPPPPPPTELPETPWPVHARLAPEALQAIERDLLEWEVDPLSAFGLRHMAGNAAEWVADIYAADAYGRMPDRDPVGPDRGRLRVVRGGSFLSQEPSDVAAHARRGVDPLSGEIPGPRRRGPDRPSIGFRCARDIAEEDAP